MKRKQPEVIDLESHSESEDDWAEAEREWAAAEAGRGRRTRRCGSCD
jgi:hypothetical protein